MLLKGKFSSIQKYHNTEPLLHTLTIGVANRQPGNVCCARIGVEETYWFPYRSTADLCGCVKDRMYSKMIQCFRGIDLLTISGGKVMSAVSQQSHF